VATWIGAVVGFVLGAVAGLLLFYLVFMAPRGQPVGVIDQRALVGALVGGLIGRRDKRCAEANGGGPG
jgi:hypothetical protein